MNPSFKRFRLVEEDTYQRERMKQLRDYDPELKGTVRIRSDVKSILDDKSITPDVKLRMVRLIQQNLKPVDKYTRSKTKPKDVSIEFTQPGFKNEIPLPQRLQHEEEGEIFEDAIDGEDGMQQELLPLTDILEQLPGTFQAKATQLIRYLEEEPNVIKVNTDNELIIDGQRIPNSNAIDMFKFMYNPRHNDPPIGYAKFIRALAFAKVAFNLVSNKNVQAYLKDAFQSGQGKLILKPIGFANLTRPPSNKPTFHNRLAKSRKRPLATSPTHLNLYKV